MDNSHKPHSRVLCEAIADGDANPFWTIEALQEHCNMMWGWYKREGYEGGEIANGTRRIIGKTGDFDFELNVIERYAQEVLNMMSALLPDLHAASEGDTAALERMKPVLQELAIVHQARWDLYHAPDGGEGA